MMASKRPTRRRPSDEFPPADTAESRMLILLESIEGKFNATMEATAATRHELKRELNEQMERMGRRVDALEVAVRHNSQCIQRLETRVEQLETRLERLETRLDSLEGAVSALQVDVRVLQDEIRELKSVVATKADLSAIAAIDKRVAVLEHKLGL